MVHLVDTIYHEVSVATYIHVRMPSSAPSPLKGFLHPYQGRSKLVQLVRPAIGL